MTPRDKTASASYLDRFLGRHPKKIDLSLDRVERLLDRLGRPHDALPPVLHVAGTNGKGSVVAFLKAMLEAAGKSVHVYTSPHLVTFHERIALNGTPISEAALADVLSRADEAVGDDAITYFEATTAAALLAFAETPADAVVLETGLGGRLDATNVVARPAAAVVTPVAMDHADYLGSDVPTIAGEKAGIFKRAAPAVIGRQTEDAMAVLEATATRIGAPVHAFGLQWSAGADSGRLVYQDEDGLLDLPAPRLPGRHQFDNAALAVAALRAADGIDVPDEALARGVETVNWPARMQRLVRGPLIDLGTERLREAPEIWLDGGHNAHAAAAVAAAIADISDRAPKPLFLIPAMMTTKTPESYFAAFAGLAEEALCVGLDKEAGFAPSALAEAARAAGVPARPFASSADALEEACAIAEGPPRILICGSLYLAGEILRDHR
ncbi:MAG: Mur ligase family protein [Pseudomonadota bacterium]